MKSKAELQDIARDLLAGMKVDYIGLTLEERDEVLDLMTEDRERRVRAVASWFTAWVTQERGKGRAEEELTLGNCLRETGALVRFGLMSKLNATEENSQSGS